ncbi:uncharacterized protein MYCGRDRAFT_94909 [Zymoseptoria tritici IPO323]|uniref:Uncharacterized protein n=1 Tax=Zymoseptoria tritici (strain CBS 115943 / IPO323) TaxID=336722 RepID=F9XI24_ZYMTI|nr:uncharacterized protein MYCGRDRAFT_94909 [Zymoseptoria tritici IPO323]EGP85503.1 hypothetical protein MYCGRDRAFT_94909 [Zymoseptoria tritici IPO323]
MCGGTQFRQDLAVARIQNQRIDAATLLIRCLPLLRYHLRRLIDLDERSRVHKLPFGYPTNTWLVTCSAELQILVEDLTERLDTHLPHLPGLYGMDPVQEVVPINGFRDPSPSPAQNSDARDTEVAHFLRSLQPLEDSVQRLVDFEQRLGDCGDWRRATYMAVMGWCALLRVELENFTGMLLDHMGPVGGRDGLRDWHTGSIVVGQAAPTIAAALAPADKLGDHPTLEVNLQCDEEAQELQDYGSRLSELLEQVYRDQDANPQSERARMQIAILHHEWDRFCERLLALYGLHARVQDGEVVGEVREAGAGQGGRGGQNGRGGPSARGSRGGHRGAGGMSGMPGPLFDFGRTAGPGRC